ncbi:MAG TPA: zinc ABC transporter substrate-binding protein [Solirubrobacteraceae bacterium]
MLGSQALVIRVSRPLLTIVAALLLAGALDACGRAGPAALRSAASGGPRFEVLAAENVWGSIAAQLAGSKASVQSIIVNPATDPHGYQPSARDARLLAAANVAIVNGVGYDSWAGQLLRASPAAGRVVLDVGALLHLPDGANPHRWYYPADVRVVARQILADYSRLDPADAAYFAAREHSFERQGLARYDALRSEIRARYKGVPVGYSESIFQGLGEDLGLDLLTPYGFTRAVAEGSDVTAAEKETVDRQASRRQIRVWVFNSQNVTPDVERVNQIAAAEHIPIVPVTETLAPAGASFQRWQERQLEELLRALSRR